MNINSIVEVKSNPKIPDISPGDTVKVSCRIVESGKERIQVIQGVIIRMRRGGAGASFTVRYVAYGIGVERTFPFYSPLVEKVEIVRRSKVRRAKLYYLRRLSGKAARKKLKRVEVKKEKAPAAGAVTEQEPEEMLAPAEEPEEVLEQAEAQAEEIVAAEAEEPVLEEKPEAEAVLEEQPEEVLEPAEAPAEEPVVAEVSETEEPVMEEKPEQAENQLPEQDQESDEEQKTT